MGALLVIAAGWTLLSVVALVLLRPMLRLAAQADREQEQQRAAPAAEIASPDDLGARRAGRAATELRRALGRPEGSNHDLEITTLASALAGADGHTWEHSLGVAELAAQVGQRLGLPAKQLVEVHLGALLHDVGKIRLPRHLLRKPGPLDPEEWRVVRRHPEWGARLVAGVPGLEGVAEIVLLHHERPDGRGYPFGLEGEQIPIASRIVSACDAFGAMTSGRPYREPLDPGSAVEELRRAAGSQFDAEVVEALAAVGEPRQPVSA